MWALLDADQPIPWADQPLRLHVFLLLLEGQLHRYVHRAALGPLQGGARDSSSPRT